MLPNRATHHIFTSSYKTIWRFSVVTGGLVHLITSEPNLWEKMVHFWFTKVFRKRAKSANVLYIIWEIYAVYKRTESDRDIAFYYFFKSLKLVATLWTFYIRIYFIEHRFSLELLWLYEISNSVYGSFIVYLGELVWPGEVNQFGSTSWGNPDSYNSEF